MPDKVLILLLRLGAFLCFAGWTWVHLYWEGPYGVLLWHDSTFELTSRWGISWEEFVGSGADDGFVQTWVARIGWCYVVCTLLTITVRSRAWLQLSGLVLGSGLLLVLSYCKYLGAHRQLPMLVEQGGQVLMPIVLVAALIWGVRHRLTVIIAMVALVATFAGHGSYALGLWPTPANFYGMISLVLQVDHDLAKIILRTAGVLDFIICVGIFIPNVRRPCALYAATWGLLTSLARPIAGMSFGLNYWGADQYIHEAVLRAPHFIIPLYLFLLWNWPQRETALTPQLNQPSASPESTPICAPAAVLSAATARPQLVNSMITMQTTETGTSAI